MSTLIDGPCKGGFLVKGAPVFLRAVRGPRGATDILDLPEDTPGETEKVYVYQREGEAFSAHLMLSPRSKSGFYAFAEYRYRPDVDGEALRDNEKWQAWVKEQEAKKA